MKQKNKFFISIIIILVCINVYTFVLPFFKSSNINLEKVNSEVSLNANQLVASFVSDEEKSNQLYAGKIIEVTGFVKEVSFLNNRKTLILYTKDEKSNIICDLHKSQTEKIKNLKKHQEIKVKGVCKGFLKDVILLNCYIDLKPN